MTKSIDVLNEQKRLFEEFQSSQQATLYNAEGQELDHKQPWIPHGKRNPMQKFDDDDFFMEIFRDADKRSVCGLSRLYTLYQWVLQTRELPGNLAEAGVYNGGSAKLIALTLGSRDKTIHLFDTFGGFPEEMVDDTKDWNKVGQSVAAEDDVKNYLKDFDNFEFHVGIFPDTTESLTDEQYNFVHIDMDLYKSAQSACEYFYPRMVKGGVIVFDDYGFWAQLGTKVAVDEFFMDKPEYPVYMPPTGQCIIIKQ